MKDHDPAPAADSEPAVATKPAAPVAEPVAEPTAAVAEPVAAPEIDAVPETTSEAEPVAEAVLEPVVDAEPVVVAEPVVDAEPVAEPVAEAEPADGVEAKAGADAVAGPGQEIAEADAPVQPEDIERTQDIVPLVFAEPWAVVEETSTADLAESYEPDEAAPRGLDRRPDLLGWLLPPLVTLVLGPSLALSIGFLVAQSETGYPTLCRTVLADNGCEETILRMAGEHGFAFLIGWLALWAMPWWRGLRAYRIGLAVGTALILIAVPLRLLSTMHIDSPY